MKQGRDWNNGFLFLGNNAILDFLNTRPVQDGEGLELLPNFDAVLRWFQAAGLLTPWEVPGLKRRWRRSRKAQQAHKQMLDFRERLRNAVLSWEAGQPVHPAMIEEINRLMVEHPMLTRLRSTGGASMTELFFDTKEPGDLFAPLAHGSATLFAKVDRTRLRMCRHCILHFLDTSKKGTRQWCSMQLCGNRAKVAAYAARKKGVSS